MASVVDGTVKDGLRTFEVHKLELPHSASRNNLTIFTKVGSFCFSIGKIQASSAMLYCTRSTNFNVYHDIKKISYPALLLPE